MGGSVWCWVGVWVDMEVELGLALGVGVEAGAGLVRGARGREQAGGFSDWRVGRAGAGGAGARLGLPTHHLHFFFCCW